MLAFHHARVAKLADARDLKSRDSKESYRFDSDPGHQEAYTADPSAALGISPAGSDARKAAQLRLAVACAPTSLRMTGLDDMEFPDAAWQRMPRRGPSALPHFPFASSGSLG